MINSLEKNNSRQKQKQKQEDLKIVVGIWNMQGVLPPLHSIKAFIDGLIGPFIDCTPDIVCVAAQQCQRSISQSFIFQEKHEWEQALKQTASGYILIQSLTMNALHTAILIKNTLGPYFTTDKKSVLKAGICNILGNKGAIGISLNLMGQKIQFINCHLEAHQFQTDRRNQVLLKIASEMVDIDERTEVFICGDLNYRVEMTHKQYHDFVGGSINTESVMHYSEMLQKDQFLNQKILKQKFFSTFAEMQISFPPTYKLSEFGPEYNKSRIPGWTDRILHRRGKVKQMHYGCFYHIYGSDHRPVFASYTVVPNSRATIFDEKFAQVKLGGCRLI